MINEFFGHLYAYEGLADLEVLLHTVPRRVTDEMNADFNKSIGSPRQRTKPGE